MTRRRLDAELVRRGLVASRGEARRAVEDGRVLVSGSLATKPDRQVSDAEAVVLVGPPPRFVGRGGHKLAAALERFALDVAGRRAIDVGASTGGFTDCLLQAGAREVVALDVGHGQLHERLRRDPRVVVVERTNVRTVDPAALGGPAPLVVADLSFISLRTVAGALVALCEPGGTIVTLVKPQFEAGRAEASRGRGVIAEPAVWRRVLGEVRDAFALAGAAMMDVMVSPITGSDGNVEFLARLRVGDGGPVVAGPGGADAALDAVVADAGASR